MIRLTKYQHTLISASLLYSSLNFVCIYSCIQTLNACTKHILIFSSVIMYIIKESHQSNHLKVLNSLIPYIHTLYILRSTPGVKDASIQLFIQCFTSKKVFQGKISEVCFIQGYNKGHDKLFFIVQFITLRIKMPEQGLDRQNEENCMQMIKKFFAPLMVSK